MFTNPFGLNDLTSTINGCAIRVHRAFGPGLLEAVYAQCLRMELCEAGLSVASRTAVPLQYRGVKLDTAFYLDLLVDDKVIVEVKSVAALAGIHTAQLLTYLRLTGRPVGLLINFNVPVLKQGVRRVVNPGRETRSASPHR